jgi:hypothetical protein
MLRVHWCTVGTRSWGSNEIMVGAVESNCAGAVRKLEGFTEGGGNSKGNPSPMRLSGAAVQPGVVAPPGTDAQEKTCPGTLPDTAVIMNDGSVSKAMP